MNSDFPTSSSSAKSNNFYKYNNNQGNYNQNQNLYGVQPNAYGTQNYPVYDQYNAYNYQPYYNNNQNLNQQQQQQYGYPYNYNNQVQDYSSNPQYQQLLLQSLGGNQAGYAVAGQVINPQVMNQNAYVDQNKTDISQLQNASVNMANYNQMNPGYNYDYAQTMQMYQMNPMNQNNQVNLVEQEGQVKKPEEK